MNFFHIEKINLTKKELEKYCLTLFGKHQVDFVDLKNFPIPCYHIVIEKDYFKVQKNKLTTFIGILDRAFAIIKSKPSILDNFYLSQYKQTLDLMNYSPFIRLDTAPTSYGFKIFEINSRHPIGPGGCAISEEFQFGLPKSKEKFQRFSLEKKIVKYLKKLVGKQKIWMVYSKTSVHDEEIAEFLLFVQSAKKFLDIELVDINDLKFQAGKVTYKGSLVKVIYGWFEHHRISNNLLEKIEHSVRAKEITLVNDFLGNLLGDKRFLALLSSDEFQKKLTKYECKIINNTLLSTSILTKGILSAVRTKKDQFVLKHALGTEGKEVFVGKSMNKNDWNKILDECKIGDWVVQKYQQLPKASLKFLFQGTISSSKRFFDFDPYFVNGRLSGYLCRTNHGYLTNFHSGGILTSLLIEK